MVSLEIKMRRVLLFGWLIALLPIGIWASDLSPQQKKMQETVSNTAGMSPSKDHEMPTAWTLRDCQRNNPNGDPCNSVRCRHYICVGNNGQGNCMSTQARLVECVQANLHWGDSFRPSQSVVADGKNEGDIGVELNAVTNSALSVASTVTEYPVAYKIEVKQGIFVDNGLKSISFTLNDYLQKGGKFRYRTYECTDDAILDKEYDTFTLSETTTLGKDGLELEMSLKEVKIPFKCYEPFYTITSTKKTTSTVKSLENYRGINKSLESYQEDRDVYYMYVDAVNAKIYQYHVKEKSTRKIHREAYELDMKSCQYKITTEDKLIENMSGQDILKSEDAGWGFEDDTKFYVSLPSSQKELSFTWGSLRENGHYSNSKQYKNKLPQIVKNYMGKTQDMLKVHRHEWINTTDKGVKFWKSLLSTCDSKVAHETLLIPPLDASEDPDIEFKIDIRPSTEAEIKVLKRKRSIK